jgi:8-oxo-dGTP diphosphatase
MSQPKAIRVVCAIIEKNGKILGAKRRKHQSQGGYWEFPGGKIDNIETPENALTREIKEELGIEILPQKKLASVLFSYPDKTVVLIPFISKILSGDPKPLEHDEIRWINKEESDALHWLPPDIEIAETYWHSNPIAT